MYVRNTTNWSRKLVESFYVLPPSRITNIVLFALLLAAGVGTTEQDTTGRFKTQAEAIDAIDLLIEHGAAVDSLDARGRNAAHGAAMQGYNDVIRHLAGLGVDLTLEDNNGHTPLDTALGLAGGFGFAGNEGVVREDTATVIRELTNSNTP